VTDLPADSPAPSGARRSWPRRLATCLGIGLALLVVGFGVLVLAVRRPRPVGREGPGADALARRMLAAIDADAWARTGAVRWTFAGMNHHLWDRRRGLVRVRWGDVEVLLHAGSPTGRAWRGGVRVTGPDEEALVRHAHEAWINDSFWLNAPAKAFDGGTSRAVVDRPGGPDLLVFYASGGSTPGDAYLWELDAEGRPVAWSMWVSIIPVGGVRATWDGWQQLSTGAWVSTDHRILGAIPLRLTDVAGAATLAELEPGPDPFARLLAPE
jgi:hypothetical protein